MDKSKIQKFAIEARQKLIAGVSQRAFNYGVTKDDFGDYNALSVNGIVLTAEEMSNRKRFIDEVKENGYKETVEKVAYTWFNRIIAIRYMEVNNYLPTRIRVFSSPDGSFAVRR